MSENSGSNKILAAIGSILLGLSFIPILGSMTLSMVLGIIGIICLFSGIKGLAMHYKDGNIYRNAFTGAIFGSMGLIIMGINEFFHDNTGIYVTDLISRMLGINTSYFVIQDFILNRPYFLPFLTIVFIFTLLMALYFGKAFNDLAKRSGERLFNVAETMMLIGAILTIILFVGLILIGIAFIIVAAALGSMKTDPNTPPAPPPPQNRYTQPTTQPTITQPATPVPLEAKFCPHCGSPVTPGAVFCSQCGKQI